jgi:hypothetical protein
MIRSRYILFAGFIFLFNLSLSAQTIKGYSKEQVKEFSSKVEDQVRFLEYLLNTVGSAETPARDKDIIIRESYLKIFRDAKVQVEDDLLLDRKVVTNKDVTAYIKDIEFFYKNVESLAEGKRRGFFPCLSGSYDYRNLPFRREDYQYQTKIC